MFRFSIAIVIAFVLCARVEAAPKLAVVPSLAQDDEITCLAQNIYFEARGEVRAGRFAVGHVVMNRVAHERFPDTVCKTVQQGGTQLHQCQFSWWCDGQSDETDDSAAWLESVEIAKTIYFGRSIDPTGGALWYHADYVSPDWQQDFVQGPRIGQHIFYGNGNYPGLHTVKLSIDNSESVMKGFGSTMKIIRPGMASERIKIVRVADVPPLFGKTNQPGDS